MRLLVSVRGPVEARAAVAGGADVVDAKDPARGALGPVRADRLAAIRRAVGAARPVSAALGDAGDAAMVAAAAAAARGVAFVKLGFGGVTSEAPARSLARAARRGLGDRLGPRRVRGLAPGPEPRAGPPGGGGRGRGRGGPAARHGPEGRP